MATAVLNDLQHIVRRWRGTRGITATIIVSLAIGVGADAIVFGAVETLFFGRPAGVAAPDRLVTIHTGQFNGGRYGLTSYPDFESLHAMASSLGRSAVFDDSLVTIARSGAFARSLRAATVSDGFFDMLGLQPAAGRFLVEADGRSDQPAAVISFSLWEALHRPAVADPVRLQIADREVRVVGVAPPFFLGLTLGRATDVWLAIERAAQLDRGHRRYRLIARLNEGAQLSDVAGELPSIAGSLSDRFPSSNKGTRESESAPRTFAAVPYTFVDPAARRGMSVLAAVLLAGTVLLFASACANAASLLLARTLAEQRELAVKLALGADRWTLSRRILLEGFLFTIVATVAGVIVASLASGLLPSLLYADDARMLDVRLGWRVVAIIAGVAACSGAILGVVPAVGGTRVPASLILRSGLTSSSPSGSLRLWLLAGQVAVSTVLLVGGAWATSGLSRTLGAGYAFASPDAVVATVRVSAQSTSSGTTAGTTLSRALRTIPSVGGVGAATTLPLGRAPTRAFQVFTPGSSARETGEAAINFVSADYFGAMNIPAIEGRSFTYGDDDWSIVVNEAFARRFLGLTALGTRVEEGSGRRVQVLGVVRNELHRMLQGAPEPTVYYLLDRAGVSTVHFIAKARPGSVVDHADVRRRLEEAGGAVTRVIDLEGHLGEALAPDRLAAALVSVSAVLALLLALLGVHGIASDVLQRRRAEVAVHLALGARAQHLAGTLFTPAMATAAAGGAFGMLCASLLMRVGESLVFGLPPLTTTTMLAAYGLLLLGVATTVFAAVVRALRESPAAVLRGQ